MNIPLERALGTSIEAQSFSTMGGILAALMFASIIFIMSSPQKRNPQDYSPYILILFSSFYLLLFSTFLYVPVAGSKFWPEQEITFLLASFVMAVAMCQVFYGMLWLFDSHGFGETFIKCSKLIFRSVVLLVVINAIGTMYNVSNNINRFFESEFNISEEFILYRMVPILVIFPIFGAAIHYIFLRKGSETAFRKISLVINACAVFFSISVGLYFVYIFTFWQSGLVDQKSMDDFLEDKFDGLLLEPSLFIHLKWILPAALAGFLFLYELGLPRSKK